MARKLSPLGHDAESRAAVRRRALMVGQIALAWNDLHHAFGLVFSVMLKRPEHPLIGQALWTALAADSAQRDLLKAAIDWQSTWLPPRRADALLWAITQTGKLSQYRNDAVHGLPILTSRDGGGLSTGFGPHNPMGRWRRHHQYALDSMKVLALVRDDLRRLERYVDGIWRALLPPFELPENFRPLPSYRPPTWPRRPALRLQQILQAEQTRIARENPNPAQRTQRKLPSPKPRSH